MKTYVFKTTFDGKRDLIVTSEGNTAEKAWQFAQTCLPEEAIRYASFRIGNGDIGKILRIALDKTSLPVINVKHGENGEAVATQQDGSKLPDSFRKRTDFSNPDEVQKEIDKAHQVGQDWNDVEAARKAKFKKWQVNISPEDQDNLIASIQKKLREVGYYDEEGNEHEENLDKIPLTTFQQMLAIDGKDECAKMFKEIQKQLKDDFKKLPKDKKDAAARAELDRDIEFFRYVLGQNTDANGGDFTERQIAQILKNGESMAKIGKPLLPWREGGKDTISHVYIHNKLLVPALQKMKKKEAFKQKMKELGIGKEAWDIDK